MTSPPGHDLIVFDQLLIVFDDLFFIPPSSIFIDFDQIMSLGPVSQQPPPRSHQF